MTIFFALEYVEKQKKTFFLKYEVFFSDIDILSTVHIMSRELWDASFRYQIINKMISQNIWISYD